MGVVVIAVVVVLVAVVAGVRPHLVAGSGQAAPVPGPPTVGDCVLDPPPGLQPHIATVLAGTVPTYPAQQIEPCNGARYGEVAAVIANPRPTVVRGGADHQYVDDQNMESCSLTANRYLGVTTPLYTFWRALLLSISTLSRPSTRQQASGQHWAACIVSPPTANPDEPPTADQRYRSSIRDALHTGRERNQLAVCMTTLDWHADSAAGDCGRPHVLEVLAVGDSGERPVSRSRLELTCRQVIGQLTGIPDPMAGGALSVQIEVEDNSSTAITTAQVPAHSNLGCGVGTAGTRRLRGSLIALGRQPIPWA